MYDTTKIILLQLTASIVECFIVCPSARGFAFVVFQEEGAVQKVLDTTPHTIDGRQVDTKKAIPHAIHQVSSNVTLHARTLRHHPHSLTL